MPTGLAPNGGQIAGVQMPALNSVTLPVGVICATRLIASSVNHTFPSGPIAMKVGTADALMPKANSVMAPLGVMRPI